MMTTTTFALLLVALLTGHAVEGRRRRAEGPQGSEGTPVAAQLEDFDCPEEFGYYPHPADCSQYYVCVFGGAVLEACTGGLLYSHELQTCDWPRNVGCGEAVPAPAPAREEVRVRAQPAQREHAIRHRPVPKHDLYTEEEEVGPAEEVESDRQQRVYRGQPATIGQVQSDRDAISTHSNAIPVSSTGRENSKLSVVSYGQQHQYNRASLAPQSYEQATAAPSRGYNTSQYIQYDPYYSQFEDAAIYKAIDEYTQYEQEYPSRGREKKPQVEIAEQERPYKTKYTPQQEVYVNQQDYTYTVQNADENVYNRQPVQKPYNRSGSSDNSGGGDSVQVAAVLSQVGPSSRSPLDRTTYDRQTTTRSETRQSPVKVITGRNEVRGLVSQTPRPFSRREETYSPTLEEGFRRGLAINRLQAVSALEGVVYDFDARAGAQAEADARSKAIRARLQEIENTVRPQLERDVTRSPSTSRPTWTEADVKTSRTPRTRFQEVDSSTQYNSVDSRTGSPRSRVQDVNSPTNYESVDSRTSNLRSRTQDVEAPTNYNVVNSRTGNSRSRFQEVDSSTHYNSVDSRSGNPWEGTDLDTRVKAFRSRVQEESTARPTWTEAPRTSSWVDLEARSKAIRTRLQEEDTVRPSTSPATSRPRTLYEAFQIVTKPAQPETTQAPFRFIVKPNRNPAEAEITLVKTEQPKSPERTTEYVPPESANQLEYSRDYEQVRDYITRYQPSVQRRPTTRVQPETVLRAQQQAREETPKFEEPIVQRPRERVRYQPEVEEPATPRTRKPTPTVQRTTTYSYQEEEEEERIPAPRSREPVSQVPQRTVASRYEIEDVPTVPRVQEKVPAVQRNSVPRYQYQNEEVTVPRSRDYTSRDSVSRTRYQPEPEVRQPVKTYLEDRPLTYRPTPKKYDVSTEQSPRYRDSSESEISRNRYTETERPVERQRTAADREQDSYDLNNLKSKTIDSYTLNRPSFLKPKVELDPSYLNNTLSQVECTNCNENQVVRVKPATYDSQTTPGLTTRGSSRHRGGATYTLSPNDAEPAPPRGTPAVSRGRPTLKPSTSIVSKAAEFVDIYRYPPSRPEPIYPTPTPDKTAAKCRKDVCLLPDCYCGGKEVPGELSVEQTPQIVLLTFDDSVNDLNKGLYSDLFEKGRTNPNGCPISATFYVSHEWTDYSHVQNLYSAGHEIASHSVSHSFGEQFSQKKWTREIAGQREILAAYGGVKQEDIRGMRAPFLAVGGNKMFKMLYDSNFTYDSSMPVYENRPPSWPYTLDYKIFHDCMIPPCPTKSYPGVWEVPMVMWQDLSGGRCSMGDACSNPPNSEGVYKMLIKNFERHFTSNRAPFGLFYHAAWFTQPHHKEGFISFLDTITNMPEVWVVTNWQMIQWVRDPTPISRLNNFQPFQCNYQDRPKKCNSPKVCNLWHKSGVRYMRTCQACPEVYPWTGKTGVRNSRVDNQIFQD